MEECTQPIRSILIIRPRFGAIHLYTEKQDKTQKVWLMFLCPKNILHRFNLQWTSQKMDDVVFNTVYMKLHEMSADICKKGKLNTCV